MGQKKDILHKNPGIFLTTLGGSWAVIPELLLWLDPEPFDLYENHPQLEKLREPLKRLPGGCVKEVWVVTTDSPTSFGGLEPLSRWLQAWKPDAPELREFRFTGSDLDSAADVRSFRELVFRTVLLARKVSGTSPLWISLAGGRKTMSADTQAAASFFGCTAVLHVLMKAPPGFFPESPEGFLEPLVPEYAEKVLPLVSERCPPRNRLSAGLVPEEFPVPQAGFNNSLLDEIETRLRDSANLFSNYRSELLDASGNTNFLALYSLPREFIQQLQKTRFGVDPLREPEELAWLRRLPKAELHCHLGGALAPEELPMAAESLAAEVESERKHWEELFSKLPDLVASEDVAAIRANWGGWKSLRAMPGLVPPLGVCAFLQHFRSHPQLLQSVIYGGLQDSENFVGFADPDTKGRTAAFKRYEALGDLQGSGLLQHEQTIKTAVRILLRRYLKENVRLLELRCSPLNYTKSDLSARQVVDAIAEVVKEFSSRIEVRLLFIASRHGQMSDVIRHVELAEELLKPDSGFPEDLLVGFDLAGAENIRSPSQLRTAFLPLLERCMAVTIHAGETASASSIWEAAYHLQADRIGHGLTLQDDPALLKRFRDRKIALELCPSSNIQIVGFQDSFLPNTRQLPEYPLKNYLHQGLRVTVNTDNPGISCTSPTQELHRATRLTKGGLSVWELLQIVRNGFRASFADHATRLQLLHKAEQDLMDLLRNYPIQMP